MTSWTYDMADEIFRGSEPTAENDAIIKAIASARETSDLRGVKKLVGQDRLVTFLKTLYPKYSLPEIEQLIGVPDSTLESWFTRLKIPVSRRHITNIAVAGAVNSLEIEEKQGIPYKKNMIEITPELAYVVGFTLGDGAVQKYMVEVFNKDENLRTYLFKLLSPHGTLHDERRENGLWRLRLSSGLIADLIKRKKEIRKDTVEYIFQNEDLTKKFIAAFWDAEGSVLKQGNYYHVYLWNSNKYLLDKIGAFLASQGIEYSTINIKRYPDRNYSLGGRKVVSRKQLFRLGIPKKSVQKWAAEIGSHLLHSKKSEMVKEILNSKEAAPK